MLKPPQEPYLTGQGNRMGIGLQVRRTYLHRCKH